MQELFAPPFQHTFERKQLYYGTYKDKPGKLRISPVRLAMCVFTLFICFIIVLMCSTAPSADLDYRTAAAAMRFEHIDADAELPISTNLQAQTIHIERFEFILSHKANYFRDRGGTRDYAPLSNGMDMVVIPSLKETVRIWRKMMLYDEKMLVRLENQGLLVWSCKAVQATLDGVMLPVLKGQAFTQIPALLLNEKIPIQEHYLIKSMTIKLGEVATKIGAGDVTLFDYLIDDIENLLRGGIVTDQEIINYALQKTNDKGVQFRLFFLSTTDHQEYKHPGLAWKQFDQTDVIRIGCEKKRHMLTAIRYIVRFMLPTESIESRRSISRSLLSQAWASSTYWGTDHKGPRPIHEFDAKKGACRSVMVDSKLTSVPYS